jgi:aspartate beta-hydroxylase
VCLKYPYINQGQVNPQFGKLLPKTFKIFEELKNVGEGPMIDIPFSSSYLSIMKPVTSLEKHYGPSNIRLRCHLPLVLPESSEACFIRVGGQIKFWKEGEIIIFDDTYEHESCNLSEVHDRIIMDFDIWHPEMTPLERDSIQKLFKQAKD